MTRARIAPRAAAIGWRIGQDPARRAKFSALPLSDATGLIFDEL